MKKTLIPVSPCARLHALSRQVLLFAVAMSVAGSAFSVRAQTSIDKANSYTSLATGSDWTGGVVPGTNNIAVWNSTAGTPALEPLGANLAWAGIQILGPGGPVIIKADGNTLTNGQAGIVGLNGIDMSGASQSLTLSNNVIVNGVENWKVASGQTLSLDGNLLYTPGSALRIYLPDSTANVYVTNGVANGMLGNSASLTNGYFATLNDTDMVGLVSSSSGLQVVGGSTISGLYSINTAGGGTPTQNGNIVCANYVTNTPGAGWRTSGAYTFNCIFINEPQIYASTVSYHGVTYPAWQLIHSSGRNITVGTWLITTNIGNSAVWDNGGGETILGGGGPTGTGNDMRIFQNNPAAPFIMANLLHASTAGANIVKMGPGMVSLQASCGDGNAITLENYEGTFEVDNGGRFDVTTVDIYGGNLTLAAPNSAAANVSPTTIFSGATNTILLNANNAQIIESNMTFNAGSSLQFTYSNNIVPSTTTPPLSVTAAASTLTLNSPVSVAVLSGKFSANTYPLVAYTGTLGGTGFSALNLTLPPHILGYLSNDVTHSYVDLVVTNVDQPIAWNTGSGVWDIGQTANWIDALGHVTTYQQLAQLGDNIVFNDNAPGPSPITVTLNTNPVPASVTVSNANNTYIISGTGGISGSGAFTKTDSGTVTLVTSNSFTGGININGGTVIFNTLGNLGAGGISFGGGTLEYNGNTDDISTRAVTLSAGGGTINTAGSIVNYANPIGNNSPGGLTKAGTGTLTLNGTNTFLGDTVVAQGTLALGTGTYLTNSPAIIVNSGGVLDAATSGVNLGLSTLSSQILAGSGQVNGVVTVAPQTTVSPGTNGATGTLAINGGFTMSGGTAYLDVAATSNDLISVTGNVTVNSGTWQINVIGTIPNGRYTLMTYSGSLSGSVANIILNFPTATQYGQLDTTVSGQIALDVATAAHDVLTWPGTGNSWDELGTLDWLNGSTPWPYTNVDAVTFNDSETGGNTTVQLMTNVQPASVTVSNTAITTYTFADGTGSGGGRIEGHASLVKDGTGSLVIQTANAYAGGTTIKNGTLQIGNGGIGDIGFGNVTNNGALVFEQGDGATHTVSGAISGTGSLTENATATVVLGANNSYSGPTTISAGTLQVGTGTASGSLGSTSAVTNNGTLVLDQSGSVSFPYSVTGSGTLAVLGSATVSLAGSSLDYQGNTYISNGVVKLAANNQLPSASTVPGSTGYLNLDGGISSAGVLDMAGFNLTQNALSGQLNNVNGIITNSSTSTTTTNVLTLWQTVATTYNGQIMDHGSTGAKTRLFVTGPGTLTLNPTTNSLTGATPYNSFSGGMVISNGSVALGTPGLNGVVNTFASQLAPGTGPITLLGTNTSLIVDGNTGSTVPTYTALTNTLIVPASQNVTVFGSQRGNINSVLQGSGILNLVTTYVRSGVDGNWSAFSGQLILSATTFGDGNIGFGLTNGLADAMLIMTTNVDMYCGTIDITWTPGSVFPIGALSGGDSSCEIEATSSGNAGGKTATLEIGGLNLSTAYGGGITDTNGVLKVGTGKLTFNGGSLLTTNVTTIGLFTYTNIDYGTNEMTYLGSTTVSNGVLALDAPENLTNSPNIVLASSSAVLDASAMGIISNLTYTLPNGATQEVLTTSTFEVVPTQTLSGLGTLNGFLQTDPGSTFNVGLPTGVFNVTSNASLAGALIMNLNSTDAPVCSELAAPSFTISNSTATLVVTNVGQGLVNGTSFTLFNHPVSGFASVSLPATDPTGTSTYSWQNNLAVNGSITLTNGGIPSVPPPLSFHLSGTTLTLSWPPPYLSYLLQSQTNSLRAGLGTNWVTITGSGSTTNFVTTINPTNPCVFYRLAP